MLPFYHIYVEVCNGKRFLNEIDISRINS